MWTFGSKARSTIEMVTVVAHTLGIMSLICVRTPSYLLLFPIDLFALFPTLRECWLGSFPLATIDILKFCGLSIHQVFLKLRFGVVQDCKFLRLTNLSTSAFLSLDGLFLRYRSRLFRVRFFVQVRHVGIQCFSLRPYKLSQFPPLRIFFDVYNLGDFLSFI